MKSHIKDPFLRSLERLEGLRNLYRKAILNYGYEVTYSSLGSLPTDILLEILTDAMTALVFAFREAREGSRNNPGLRFVDDVDVVKHSVEETPARAGLHTLKGMRINFPSQKFTATSQELEILKNLTSAFVRVRRGKTIKASFMEAFKYSNLIRPPSSGRTKTQKSKADYHWWRRRKALGL